MKNKMILVLSGLIMSNTVLGKVGGEDDVFETKDVFGSNEAQPVHQKKTTINKEVKEEPTITNEELKVQVIPYWRDVYCNGIEIQEGMDQYIVEPPIYKKDIEETLAKLRPFYTDKAKKLGKKPIVFKYQAFYLYEPLELIEETDEFSIESFWVWQYCNDTNEFGKFYNALIKYGKPIVFKDVKPTCMDKIEKNYDLSNCKINYRAEIESFDEYLKVKKLGMKNLTATVNFKPFSDQNLLEHLNDGKNMSTKSMELLSESLNKYIIESNILTERLFDCFEYFLKKSGRMSQDSPNSVKRSLGHYSGYVIPRIKEAEKFPITEEKELRKQLYAYTRDNRIKEIRINNLWVSNSYEKGTVSIPIEYVSCLKLNCVTPLVNPKNTEDILFVPKEICMLENVTCNILFCKNLSEDIGKNVSCKTIIYLDEEIINAKFLNHLVNYLDKIKNKIKNLETVWIGCDSKNFYMTKMAFTYQIIKDAVKPLEEKNISLGYYDNEKLYNDYENYIKAKNIVHLSGYVNVKNKPEELSDEEWKQVLVLKQKVKEIIREIQANGVKLQIN